MNRNTINIIISGDIIKKYTVPTIEESNGQKVPDMQHEHILSINSKQFETAIKELKNVSDSTTFETKNQNFSVSAAGDINKLCIPLDSEIIKDSNVLCKYPLDFLLKFVAAKQLKEKVRLSFGETYPLKIEYNDTYGFNLTFILAPRVETD